MKPFLVTRIQPDGYVHAQALAEATTYLHACLVACGEQAELATNRFELGAVNIVTCAHLLDVQFAAQLPADTIIFNSERLVPPTDWPLDSPVYRGLLDRLHVWDYSARNVAALGHDRASVIPFGWCPDLVRYAALPAPDAPLVFYGVVTPRRQRILDALRARGVAVDVVFGEYGEARDRRVARALGVLNLHKLDDAQLFEPIRCFDPLIHGVAVLSEESPDPAADVMRDAVFWLHGDALVDDVVRLVADRADLLRRAADHAARFRARSPLPAIAAAVAAFRQRAAAAAPARR